MHTLAMNCPLEKKMVLFRVGGLISCAWHIQCFCLWFSVLCGSAKYSSTTQCIPESSTPLQLLCTHKTAICMLWQNKKRKASVKVLCNADEVSTTYISDIVTTVHAHRQFLAKWLKVLDCRQSTRNTLCYWGTGECTRVRSVLHTRTVNVLWNAAT